MPLLLQRSPPPCAQIPLLFVTCLCRFTAVLQLSSGTLVVGGVWVTVLDGQLSSLYTHSPVITAAMQILHICTALHRLAPLLLSPRHLCLPPTSPLPHQDHPNISPCCFLKLPWVTGPRAQIMLACRGGAGQRGQEWVRCVETQSALFSYGVVFLAKAAITDQRLVLNSEFKELWLWMPALAADVNHIPQPHQGEETESKFREPDSLQWFNMGVSPKYKVLGLCWWMDNRIHLIVCSKTEMLVFTLWHHTCYGAAELWSTEKETWQTNSYQFWNLYFSDAREKITNTQG